MTRRLGIILSVPVILAMMGGCAGLTGGQSASPATPGEKARAAREEAIANARETFRQAKEAGGELAAPFEYYLAEAYLDLAIHEAGGGDKEGVIAFAEQSAANSEEAIRAARRSAQ